MPCRFQTQQWIKPGGIYEILNLSFPFSDFQLGRFMVSEWRSSRSEREVVPV